MLPNMPDLYNREVQLEITPKQAEGKAPKNEKPHPVPDFMELCRSLRDCRPSKEEEEDAVDFPKKRLVSDFLRKWSGIIKDSPDLPDEEETLVDKLRYKYLKKKYDIDGSYVSDEDVDDARYEYLMEKYK